MHDSFHSLIAQLLEPGRSVSWHPYIDIADENSYAKLLSAFLVQLAGPLHVHYKESSSILCGADSPLSHFLLHALKDIDRELKEKVEAGDDFLHTLEKTASQFPTLGNKDAREALYDVFFPEGAHIKDHEAEHIRNLRQKRTVRVTEINADTITDPGREIIFTANALLGMPAPHQNVDDLPVSDNIRKVLKEVALEKQRYWYDHPVLIGTEPEHNEILYGLQALDRAVGFEKENGHMETGCKLTCLMSVSTTHDGLQQLAKCYIEDELAKVGGLKHLNVYIFTEVDTERITEQIMKPAICEMLGREVELDILGVNGHYGKHYCFLKAMPAIWQTLIDDRVKGTFKIDLDQVFPQEVLVKETGQSAFEHFMTPLWGATGIDADGNSVELDMIAGALVNEKDIGQSLFTPDVTFPEHTSSPDETIFFSRLPQALSTAAEMLTRYGEHDIDGDKKCLYRIHVTGGTNGILIRALKKYRPFTPSFIGRAEDQCYVLSTFGKRNTRLAYLHEDGLIMRHDKEAFASDAIKAANIGTAVADHVRILQFSEYARVLTQGDTARIKDLIDPFTGCFVSRIPATLTLLRFALKALAFHRKGTEAALKEFVETGLERLDETLDFIRGKESKLAQQYYKEEEEWNIFYDALVEFDKGDFSAYATQARTIVSECQLKA